MRGLRGLIARCGLTALPLGLVILLCCLMMGWPGKHQEQASSASPQKEELPMAFMSVAEAAVPEDRAPKNNTGNEPAAFERLHITHAHINVPN